MSSRHLLVGGLRWGFTLREGRFTAWWRDEPILFHDARDGRGALGPAVATPHAGRQSAQPPTAPSVQAPAIQTDIAVAQAQRVVDRTCRRCHNDGTLAGDLSLAGFDVADPERQPAVTEKIIRKLAAGMMPPPAAARPDEAVLTGLTDTLAARIDAVAAANPNPGRRTFQRLNRSEYGRSVRDLLDLEVDIAAFLPPDTLSHGFDNIADVQTLSPTLMEGCLRAASRISTAAVGDRDAAASEATFKVPRTASQMRHVEGAPFGTRGGVSVLHNFPADGEYVFRMMLNGEPTGRLFGTTDADGEQLEVSIDGERVALLDIDPFISESDPTGLNMQTDPIAVRAGSHRVSAAFIERFAGPVDDLIAPIEHTLADTQIGTAYGITLLPHLRDLSIVGPYRVTGVSETPSRRAIFTCRPTSPDDEMACATRIVTQEEVDAVQLLAALLDAGADPDARVVRRLWFSPTSHNRLWTTRPVPRHFGARRRQAMSSRCGSCWRPAPTPICRPWMGPRR